MNTDTAKKIMPFCLLLTIISGSAYAQPKNRIIDYSVIQPSSWIIPQNDTLAYSFETYSGRKKALILKRNILNYKSASIAYPKALEFKDGIIELDIASPGGKTGFAGLAFRIEDEHHYEALYFRPGSSGTIHAIQYMPEKQAEFNWWDYEDEKYQARAVIPLTEWFHVKAIVKGNKLSVFLHHETTPVFEYSDLDPGLKKGSVGFWLGNSPKGAYKNLRITTF